MSDKVKLDQIRGAALDRIKRSERNFKLVIFAAAVWEAFFLVAFLVAADFSNRTHVLLLLATVGSYTFIVLGLFALGVHVNRGILRVLKALELLRS